MGGSGGFLGGFLGVPGGIPCPRLVQGLHNPLCPTPLFKASAPTLLRVNSRIADEIGRKKGGGEGARMSDTEEKLLYVIERVGYLRVGLLKACPRPAQGPQTKTQKRKSDVPEGNV